MPCLDFSGELSVFASVKCTLESTCQGSRSLLFGTVVARGGGTADSYETCQDSRFPGRVQGKEKRKERCLCSVQKVLTFQASDKEILRTYH